MSGQGRRQSPAENKQTGQARGDRELLLYQHRQSYNLRVIGVSNVPERIGGGQRTTELIVGGDWRGDGRRRRPLHHNTQYTHTVVTHHSHTFHYIFFVFFLTFNKTLQHSYFNNCTTSIS